MLSNIYKDAYQRVLFLTGICPIHETKNSPKSATKKSNQNIFFLCGIC